MNRKTRPLFLVALAILLTASVTTASVATASGGATIENIATADGITLKATYTSPGKPGPGVVLLHMCNSDRSAWTGLAHQLAARGIHSLALDYRGYGNSGGERPVRREVRDEKWPGDVDAAFELLRSKPGVDSTRMGAAGGSCGVHEAIQLARRHPGEVQALVLLAGTTDPAGSDFLAQNPWLPVLGSASLDDGQAVDLMRWTMEFSSNEENRFLEYDHGGHGTEMFSAHQDLEPAIVDWFAQHLVDQPVKKPETVAPRPGPSAALIQDLSKPGGVARWRAAKAKDKNLIMPPEAVLNAEGYRLVAAGETKQAVELLSFVVESFPKSANALDSLADAYLADGQAKQAEKTARLAIAAIPNDPNLPEQFAEAVRRSAEGKIPQADQKP